MISTEVFSILDRCLYNDTNLNDYFNISTLILPISTFLDSIEESLSVAQNDELIGSALLDLDYIIKVLTNY